MVRSGYLCAQPAVTQLAGGEVLRVSAYLYNEVSEITGFYQSLDEILSWIGPPAFG
jgi:cysteine desulfurase/selenocysteine lyase